MEMDKLPIEEIIFENRNKTYGAYVIRKSYSKTITKALTYSTIFVTLLLLTPMIYRKFNPTVLDVVKSTQVNFILKSPPSIDEKLIQVKFPQLPPPKVFADIKLNVCTIDEMLDETVSEENPLIICYNFPSVDTTIQECGVEIETGIREKADEAVFIATQMPTFLGGKSELDKFLSKNLQYPKQAKDIRIEGKVYVKFIVEEDGKLSQITVIKGIGYGCDEEAERLMKLMPAWTAGKQDGKSIAIRYYLPIVFKLE